MGRLFIFLLIAVVIGVETALPAEICVRDDLSREVCVNGYVRRVVSFSPSLTEIVFAVGAGSALVGRTARCNRPPEALKVSVIGAYMNPDFERVASVRPDLVLTARTDARREFIKKLEDLGIPVFVDDGSNSDGVLESIRRVGVLLSREHEASSLVNELKERRRAVHQKVAPAAKPTVLLAVGLRPLVAAGGKSFIGALVREAGGINVAEEAAVPYPKFSVEEVIRKDPNVILVLDKECPDQDRCAREWSRFPVLSAVRNGRVFALDSDLMARPAAGIVESLEKLASILHPEVFGSGSELRP